MVSQITKTQFLCLAYVRAIAEKMPFFRPSLRFAVSRYRYYLCGPDVVKPQRAKCVQDDGVLIFANAVFTDGKIASNRGIENKTQNK